MPPLTPTPPATAFSPPVLQRHDKAFIQQALYRAIVLVIVVSLALILLMLALGDSRLLVPTMGILLTQIIALFFVRQQQIYWATLLIPGGIFVGIFLSGFSIPHYYALAAGFYGLTIVAVGILLGKRAVWVITVAALISNIGIYLYHFYPDLPTLYNHYPLHVLLTSTQIILFAVTINLITSDMNSNYQRLTKSYDNLAQTQITLQKFAQELQNSNAALRQSQQTKQAILDSIPDMMAVITREGVYLDYKALSYFRAEDPPESVIGQSVHDLLSPEMAAQRLARIATVLDTGEVLEYEERQPARGEWRYFASRIMSLNEERVLVMMRDITGEKEREQIELATQKLESVGLLAGGIAHDFNNLLTGMMTQTTLAMRKLEEGHTAVRHLQKADTAMQRAAHLTRQLLAYTGQGHFQLSQVNLNQLLDENADFLQAGLARPVNIQLQLAPDLPLITADEGQLQQLVMNLIINAAEASPEPDAHIEISTNLCDQAELEAIMAEAHQPLSELSDEQYICLTIRDEGIGMSPETVQRIFDPFFTTKGHGRGLGLSAIWGIIRSYHGTIHVDSTIGAGTTFTIYLPTNTVPASINLNYTHTNKRAQFSLRPTPLPATTSSPSPSKNAGPA